MFIDGLTNADSTPTLRAAIGFAAGRQKLIAHNIANLSTPNFRPADVSVNEFRSQLRDAIDARRKQWGSHRGELKLSKTRQVEQKADGSLLLSPQESGRGVLFHDRNDRDLERTMQDLAENVAFFRVASDLLKTRNDMLNAAIRERV
ncbi:MAG: hypothetical protein AAGB34_06265 [Planctomycetota bacterium]